MKRKKTLEIHLNQLESLQALVGVDRTVIDKLILKAKKENNRTANKRLHILKVKLIEEEHNRRVSKLVANSILKQMQDK